VRNFATVALPSCSISPGSDQRSNRSEGERIQGSVRSAAREALEQGAADGGLRSGGLHFVADVGWSGRDAGRGGIGRASGVPVQPAGLSPRAQDSRSPARCQWENYTSASGATSSTVTTSACLGAAGVVFPACPLNLGPVTSTTSSTPTRHIGQPVQRHCQRRRSNVYCNVAVTNNVPAGTASPASPLTNASDR